MKFISLFSGIGGLDLGLEWAGWECVAQCEQDPFCRQILAKHWPDVPCWQDVRSVGGSMLPPCDAVVGGFPCQDISSAGKGAGIEGSRSGLWKEMHRIIRDAGPRWVVAENVPALRTRGADVVLGDLEELGYACWPIVVGAVHAGAPHRRQRVFVVGYAESLVDGERCAIPAGPGRPKQTEVDNDGPSRELADRDDAGLEGRRLDGQDTDERVAGAECAAVADRESQRREAEGDRGQDGHTDCGCGETVANAKGESGGERPDWRRSGPWRREPQDPCDSFPPGPAGHVAWSHVLLDHPNIAPATSIESQLCRVPDGFSERVGRRWRKESLKALGNGVVPQVAEAVGRAINQVDTQLKMEGTDA